MKSLILSLLALTLYSTAAAQSHNISIYSIDNLEFILELEGERVSDEYSTEQEARGLKKDMVNAKVIFKDESIKPISSVIQITLPGISGGSVNVIYVIKKNKKGKFKIKFESRS